MRLCSLPGLPRGGEDGAKSTGGINDANPESGNIGVLLPLVTNPDGSWSITGDRNVDADPDRHASGAPSNLTYSFPTSGSNYNGAGFDTQGVSYYHVDPRRAAAGGGARGLRADLGGHRS